MAGQVSKTNVVNVKTTNTTNATLVAKGSFILRGWSLSSKAAAKVWIKFYDLARVPDPTKDIPLFKIAVDTVVPNNQAFTHGIPFYSGLAYLITAAVGDADATATAADDLNGTFDYHPRG